MMSNHADLKLRPHHIGMFIDEKGRIRDRMPLRVYVKNQYGIDLVNSLKSIMSQIVPDTVIEIVSGQDDLCVHCPFSDPCRSRDYETIKKIIMQNSPRYISKQIEMITSKDNPETADESCLEEYGIKTGQTYTAKELGSFVRGYCLIRRGPNNNENL